MRFPDSGFFIAFLMALVITLFAGCAMFSGVEAYKQSPSCARMETICKAYDNHPEQRRGLETDTVLILKQECANARMFCSEDVHHATRNPMDPKLR